MAGEDNLIPMSERSKDEVREIAAKGGRNSGETRRRKRAMRESLEILLDLKLKNGKECSVENVKSFADLKGKNITVEQALLIAQIQKALKGDTTALAFIRDTSGQAPKQEVDFSGAIPVVISGEEDLED
jgi:hypothetical protein